MAEIPVERKPRSPLPLILAILLLAVVAYFAWRYLGANKAGDDATAPAPAAVSDTAAR
ncbi:MAG TPA: hypothetical protein VJT67_01490 [Longimicrobiaceae bacterium]|nr:hypothetical protein [Longimicrobiaceae bacterium]